MKTDKCLVHVILIFFIILKMNVFAQIPFLEKENIKRFDSKTGIIRAIYNVNSAVYSGSPDQIAKQYLISQKDLFKMKNNLGDLEILEINDSPAGHHVCYRQMYDGIPVVGSETVVSINKNNRISMVVTDYKPNLRLNTNPDMSAENALINAKTASECEPDEKIKLYNNNLAVYVDDNNIAFLIWQISFTRLLHDASWIIFIDAKAGNVLKIWNPDKSYYSGTGKVFDPDPGTYLSSLTVSDSLLQTAYKTVTLKNLDGPDANGKYMLRGKYAYSDSISGVIDPALARETDPDNFTYNRSQSGFQEVNVYYHIDKMRTYIDSMGFSPTWDYVAVNSEKIAFDAHNHNSAKAKYVPTNQTIQFGDFFHDRFAEDQSFILHEYGHALHDALLNGSTQYDNTDTKRIGEGVSEYMSISYRRTTQSTNPFRPNARNNWGNTANPDSIFIFNESVAKYPGEYPNYQWYSSNQYDGGKIWASTLMDLEYNTATNPSSGSNLGRYVTSRLMLQSFRYLTPTNNVFDNVNAIMQADRDLYNGAHLDDIFAVFENRGFFDDYEKSGTISSNETWEDHIHVSGDITVNSGVTLTIAAGTYVYFDSNTGLTINGLLSAQGTSSSPIVFTSADGSSWDGIHLYSSNSTLKYCDISDAQKGIYVYNSLPDIEQCYLHDNTYGCYINYLSDPVFYSNTFSENSYGIKCYNSDAHFGEPHQVPAGSPNPGYNDIIDNNYGLFATQNSDVFLGMDEATQSLGGYNSLDSNSTLDILATSSSDVSAEYNWWGSDGADNSKDGSSNIYTYNSLSADPDGGSSLAKISRSSIEEDNFNPNDVDDNEPGELLRLARYLKYLGRFDEALVISERIVANYPASNYAVRAVLNIFSLSRRSDIVDIEKYCSDKINAKDNSDQVKIVSNEILTSKYMSDKKNILAEARCNDLLSNYPGTKSEKYALFNLFLLANQDAGKTDEAEYYKSELENKYPSDMVTLDAKSLSGEEVDWSLAKERIEESDEIATERLLPEEYALYPAYPNPFNPSTTFSFDLPEVARVNIEIYNIQGQRVWTFRQSTNEFPMGNHQIVWQGVNDLGNTLSSGMYFVKFWSKNYTANQKILLIK